MPIDSCARVHRQARVASSARVGAWVEIGANVVVGANSIISSHVSIAGDTEIGESCEILPFSALGCKPEHLGDQGEKTRLVIGANSVIREHVTISRGTKAGGGITTVGKGCYIMSKSHIAHDCIIGDGAVLGAYCGLSGHSYIGARTVLLGKCATQPFVRIGEDCYLIAGTELMFDVPPMMVATRHCLRGINVRGLLMRGARREDISALKIFYDRLTKQRGAFDMRAQSLRGEFAQCSEVQKICDFVAAAHRYPWLTPYPDINKSRYTDEQAET